MTLDQAAQRKKEKLITFTKSLKNFGKNPEELRDQLYRAKAMLEMDFFPYIRLALEHYVGLNDSQFVISKLEGDETGFIVAASNPFCAMALHLPWGKDQINITILAQENEPDCYMVTDNQTGVIYSVNKVMTS